MGALEVYSSVDQTKKVKTNKKGLHYLKFHSFWLSSQNSCDLDELLSEDQKKRSSSQKFYEIRCESTKITKKQYLLASYKTVNINVGVLGLDLHSSSPEPVNFFGAQFSLGGHNFRLGGTSNHLGGARPGMPPSGAGPELE